jgi:ribosomal-protein-alanine N-acetyltransferase
MTSKGAVTLETERLILRRFALGDAEAMFRNWANDPEVMRFTFYDTAQTADDARNIIAGWFGACESAAFEVFAIVLKQSGELIGAIDYAVTDDEAHSAEVSYEIGKRWWYHGYAAEALTALL